MRITFFSQVNATDDRVHTALHWAAVSDNGKAVDLLFDAGIDHSTEAFPVCTALQIAACTGSPQVIKAILVQDPTQTLNQCLHFSFIVGGCSPKVVILLLEPKADIDEPYAVTSTFIAWSVLFKVKSLTHRFRPSLLSTLAYHNHGATPLMLLVWHVSSLDADTIDCGRYKIMRAPSGKLKMGKSGRPHKQRGLNKLFLA